MLLVFAAAAAAAATVERHFAVEGLLSGMCPLFV